MGTVTYLRSWAFWCLCVGTLTLVVSCSTGEESPTVSTKVGAAEGDPKVSIVSPPDNVEIPALPGGNDVSIVFLAEDVDLGPGGGQYQVRFYLDGEEDGILTGGTSYTFEDVPFGMHQVVAEIVDSEGDPLPNPESVDVIHIKLFTACKEAVDCEDEAFCSNANCLSNECRYGPKEGCCDNAFDCPFDWFCEEHVCKQCLADSHCDDGSVCTIDSCGEGGICEHEWIEGCCETAEHCDDGLFCTIDTCNLNTCQHEDSDDELCCNNDNDCVPPHPCMASMCYTQTTGFAEIQFCRYGPLLAGCCTDDSNCYDANPCTTDVCEKVPDSTCCDAHFGLGCSDFVCETNICGQDPFCCEEAWDELCAYMAMAVCDTCTSCCHATEATGCAYVQCQAEICEDDPFCCEEQWDELCAEAAQDDCEVCSEDGQTGQCVYEDDESKPNCCLVDSQCDDDDPSTLDECVEGECFNGDIPGYCELSGAPAILINELMVLTADDENREYIELYNPGPDLVDLVGWTIELSPSGDSYTIDASDASAGAVSLFTVPDTYIVLGRSLDKDDIGFIPNAEYGDAFDLPDPVNDGTFTATVSLKDAEGEVVDSVTYDHSWPIEEGRSMEAIHAWADRNDSNSWRASGYSDVASDNLKFGKEQFGLPQFGSPRYFNKSSLEGIPHVACEVEEGAGDCEVSLCSMDSTCVIGLATGCCTEDAHCDTFDPCTESSCNVAGQTCNAPTDVIGCCKSDSECLDENPCNIDRCINNECRYSPNIVPGCCHEDADCDDHDACTIDDCDEPGNECLPPVPVIPIGGAQCCNTDEECPQGQSCDGLLDLCIADDDSACGGCDDQNPCTQDSCNPVTLECSNTPLIGCCEEDGDCPDDGHSCTTPSCNAGDCELDYEEGCCEIASDCPDADNDPCTAEICVSGSCDTEPVVDCCTSNEECADEDVCTLDTCTNNSCHNTPLIGCCEDAGDCDDFDDCTSNECNDNACEYEHEIGCCHEGSSQSQLAEQCGADSDGDGNCYTWSCDGGECEELLNPACCEDAGDCEDNDDCTLDACVAGTCKNTIQVGDGCCETDADCNPGETCSEAGTCEVGCISKCEFDEERTVDAGGDGQSACRYFYTEEDCNAAYHLTGSGTYASCGWDGSYCIGCGPGSGGNCENTCAPDTCADPSLTNYVGGPGAGACSEIEDEETCVISWHTGAGGAASCYWAGFGCAGCGPNNEGYSCFNTCAAGGGCPNPALTEYAGGAGTNACQQYTDQASCESAWHAGSLGWGSCAWDGSACFGCGPGNDGGDCDNQCFTEGGCGLDPSRTEFAGGPNQSACQQYDDEASCNAAYHMGSGSVVSSCYWDGSGCSGCGQNSGDKCEDTCNPPYCGTPGQGSCCEAKGTTGCEDIGTQDCVCDLLPYCCDVSWAQACVDLAGTECGAGCDPPGDGCESDDDCGDLEFCDPDGYCIALCEQDCPGDPDLTFVGGPDTEACYNLFSQEACEASYHQTYFDTYASCYWDGSECYGCGLDTCDTCQTSETLSCAPEIDNYVGGPEASACGVADDQAECETSYHRTGDGYLAPCYWDADDEDCYGCGSGNDDHPACTKCVRECTAIPSRTLYPDSNSSACRDFLDADSCGLAFHTTDGGSGYDAPCGWNGSTCIGCGPSNAGEDFCDGITTCEVGSCGSLNFGDCCEAATGSGCGDDDIEACVCDIDASCCAGAWSVYCVALATASCGAGCAPECTVDEDCEGDDVCKGGLCGASCLDTSPCGDRTYDAGGPGTNACSTISDQATCEDAYHETSYGHLAPCYWQGYCTGCGEEGCPGTCPTSGAACGDPSRTVLASGGEEACRVFGSEAECLSAYHVTSYGDYASCAWNGSNCYGCGPANEGESCENTCAAPSCNGDPHRVLLAGGPGESACQQYTTEIACDHAYHETSEGEAGSCFWDGSGCYGCGYSNDGGPCTNTCELASCDAGGPAADCCSAAAGPGCELDPGVESCVCLNYSYCCDVEWAQFCGDYARYMCDAECANQCNGTGDCEEGESCEDGVCVGICEPAGGGDSGGGDSSDCCSPHQYQGCDDPTCESDVCILDPYCCDTEWDSYCSNCAKQGQGIEISCAGLVDCPCAPAGELDCGDIDAGGPFGSACQGLDQATCEIAYHTGDNGPAPCHWSGSWCVGCGGNNGECTPSCEVVGGGCEGDPSKTIDSGGPGAAACGNNYTQAECEAAYHTTGAGTIASCAWDGSSCYGCGPGRIGCTDTCATCAAGDLSLNAGGPYTEPCHQYDDYPDACMAAWHISGGDGLPTPCWFDFDIYACRGCGDGGPDGQSCQRTCDSCDDGSRVLFAYEELTGGSACGEFDNQAACNAAYHLGSGGVASCFWDGSECYGCASNDGFACDDQCSLDSCGLGPTTVF